MSKFNFRTLVMLVTFIVIATPLFAQQRPGPLIDQMRRDQSQITQDQKEVREQLLIEESSEVNLNLILSHAVKDVYRSIKIGGVKFDDATDVFNNLQISLKNDIELSDLKPLEGSELISFSSYTFMISTIYEGAVAPSGAGRLIAIDGKTTRQDGPCVYTVEVRTFSEGRNFDPASWENATQQYACNDVKSGKSIPSIKEFYLSRIAISLKGAK